MIQYLPGKRDRKTVSSEVIPEMTNLVMSIALIFMYFNDLAFAVSPT